MNKFKAFVLILILIIICAGCKSDAEKARAMLNEAHVLMREQNGSDAKAILLEIIDKYPNTVEATEANKLLNPLQMRGFIAKNEIARIAISEIKGSLNSYMIEVGSYPSESEGLEVLIENMGNTANWNGPYMKKMPLDPWGNPYIYRFPSQHGLDYDLCSAGADGIGDTEDDICNWM